MRKHLLMLPLSLLFVLAACGEDETAKTDAGDNESPLADSNTPAPPTQPSTQVASDDISWFMRGGSLNRGSTVKAWRIADEKERLASAADLLSMKVSDLPAPQEAAQMARDLAAKITEAAEAGEQGPLGPIVDRAAEE